MEGRCCVLLFIVLILIMRQHRDVEDPNFSEVLKFIHCGSSFTAPVEAVHVIR